MCVSSIFNTSFIESIDLYIYFIFRNIQQPCDYSQNFPLSVKTKCKQQYVYRNLLAINSDGKPVMEHFQFPSCCKCMVTSSYGTRFGDDEHRRDRLILA